MPRRDRRPVRPVVEGSHPGMIRPVFDELSAARPSATSRLHLRRRHAFLSLPIDRRLPHATPRGRGGGALLRPRLRRHGRREPRLGEDHRRKARTSSPRATFVYDSKSRAGPPSRTCAFGPVPTRSAYLIDAADFHRLPPVRAPRQDQDFLDFAKPGATFLPNSPYGPAEDLGSPVSAVQKLLVDKEDDFWVIDALAGAAETGMAADQHDHAQPCFFHLSGVLPSAEAIERIRSSSTRPTSSAAGGRRPPTTAAIDASIARLGHARSAAGRDRPCASARRGPQRRTSSRKTDRRPHGRRRRPASGLGPSRSTGRTRGHDQIRERAIALELPIWIPRSASIAASARWSARTPRSDEGLPGRPPSEGAPARLSQSRIQVPRPA